MAKKFSFILFSISDFKRVSQSYGKTKSFNRRSRKINKINRERKLFNPISSYYSRIDFFTAYFILCEVVDITRSLTPKKLVSYSGIVTPIHQSDIFSYTGKITKQGNKYRRWALIEISQKAKVAITNRLTHIIWVVLIYRIL